MSEIPVINESYYTYTHLIIHLILPTVNIDDYTLELIIFPTQHK